MIAIFPLVVLIVGLLIYFAAAANPKLAEVGRLMFACGLLVLCFSLAGKTLRLLT